MSKPSLKEIVAQIKKEGAAPPPPPADHRKDFSKSTPNKAPLTPGKIAPKAVPVKALSPIREMQKAIQEFAEASVKYRRSKDPKKDSRGRVVLEHGKPTYDVDPSDSRRDFNDFLAENFSANADIHGDEYSANESDVTQQSKMPTDIIQLNNVIDGLRRIGPGSKESMSDGVWDFRTNNAVRNVYAFASALVSASEALVMGGTLNNPDMFKRNDLQALAKALPKEEDPVASKVSQEELSRDAQVITPLVKKLTRFFDFYSKKVMNHPAYKRYIESDPDKNPNAPPLFSVKPGGVDPYKPDQSDPRQVEIMNNPKSFALPQLTLNSKSGTPVNLNGKLTLDYLASRDGLISLMKNHLGYNDNEINNGPLMRKIVNSILTQVNDFISKNSLLVKAPPKKSNTGVA
jgi:hypothetical protein